MDDLFNGVTEKVEKSVTPVVNITKKPVEKKKPVPKKKPVTKMVAKKKFEKKVTPIGDIKIEKGIPLPIPRQRYPFATMKIGESFFSDKSGVQNLSSIYSKKGKAKFTCRKVEGGFRVWRVS